MSGTFLKKKNSCDLCVRKGEGRDASENKFFVLAVERCNTRFGINPNVNEESWIELDFQLKYL